MKAHLHSLIIAGFLVVACKTYAQQFSIEPVIARPSVEGSPKIFISPNPVHGDAFFYIQIDSCETRNTDNLIIYNSSGFPIESKPLLLLEGNNRFLVSASAFDPGNYVVRITGKDIPGYSFSTQIQVD
ncbi:MAG: T9SS type A sorting domain-containing protein [Bacteroidetes bacterium]|nr:T9SS type A sorting domain-containing protein [Bacteroidota bacterium]MBS1933959.1 T9SS type A sorting domain-containing protein [Bacteroidota bacterium]